MTSKIGEWHLPSNDGWNNIKFEAGLIQQATGQLEYSITLTGMFWKRVDASATPAVFETLVDDFTIVLPSVLISASACAMLLSDFDNWLTSYAPFSRKLCADPDQMLLLALGKRDDCRNSVDHPAFTFSYHAPRCHLEIFYVTDQSCISQAINGLNTLLNNCDHQFNN